MATTRKPQMTSLSPPGSGPSGTPYDRSELDAQGGVPNLPTPQAGAGQFAQPPVDAQPQGLVAGMGAQNTDQLTGAQLGQLEADPEDVAAQEMEAALNDPQTPPAEKQAIEMQLMLAAKKQMLGGQ